MDDDVIDQLVTEFMSVTGGSVTDARQYIEMTGGDVNMAVNLFLENNVPKPDSSNDFGGESFEDDEEYVRAPIPQREDVLNPAFAMPPMPGYFNPTFPNVRVTQGITAPRLVWEQSNGTERSSRLAEQFRRPTEILYSGSWDQAIEEGKLDRKWILVHMIDPTEFSSHLANRDYWKHIGVINLIKKHFIFLQLGSETAEGRQYRNFYPFENYPHISILDPRTLERVHRWDTVLDVDVFCDQLRNFVSTHTLDENKLYNIRQEEADNDNFLDLTEDEQIRLAIQLSQQEQKLIDSMEDDEKLDSPIVIDDEDTMKTSQSGVSEAEMDPIVRLPVCEEPEPPKSSETVGIAFRLDGNVRKNRQFLKTDLVSHVYCCVKAYLSEEQQNEPFELLMHNQTTSDKLEQTVMEANIANSMLTLTWK